MFELVLLPCFGRNARMQRKARALSDVGARAIRIRRQRLEREHTGG
jgi:hypothetical protein